MVVISHFQYNNELQWKLKQPIDIWIWLCAGAREREKRTSSERRPAVEAISPNVLCMRHQATTRRCWRMWKWLWRFRPKQFCMDCEYWQALNGEILIGSADTILFDKLTPAKCIFLVLRSKSKNKKELFKEYCYFWNQFKLRHHFLIISLSPLHWFRTRNQLFIIRIKEPFTHNHVQTSGFFLHILFCCRKKTSGRSKNNTQKTKKQSSFTSKCLQAKRGKWGN